MGRVSSTVTGLGTPRFDGESGTLRVASGREETLFWNAATSTWVSNSYLAMRQFDNVGMASQGDSTIWKYPVSVESPAPGVNDTQYGFQIHTVIEPAELVDAGLHLQEHLSAEIGNVEQVGTGPAEIALNWYELAVGDPFLSPEGTNHGVHLVADRAPANYHHWWSTGWQNSPVADPTDGYNWYPELYLQGPGASFRNLTAHYRWVGGTVGSTGSFEEPVQYPNLPNVVAWHRATTIPEADDTAIAQWSDYSARGRVLTQPTSGKRPVVRRDAPNGVRHVRFDGANDSLFTDVVVPIVQPWSAFLVLRQNTGGGTQQVWFGPHSSGAPLFYRGDATDQVNAWLGGTDLIYHRSSAWPMPFTIWSIVCDGSSTTIWENLTPVATGDGGSAGLSSYMLGNNGGETLPAKIDVAELIVAAGAVGDSARTSVVNALNAVHGIFA